jgi:hypothetical protein
MFLTPNAILMGNVKFTVERQLSECWLSELPIIQIGPKHKIKN